MKQAPRPIQNKTSAGRPAAGAAGALQRRHALTGFLFTLPFLAGFFVFFLLPFCISVGQSFFKPGRFAGVENYAEVFTSDAFRLAAFNTARFMGIGVPLIMVLSMVFALLLYRRFTGASFIRSVFLFPLVVPIASTVMVMQVFFAEGGMANGLLSALGLPVQSWLQSEWAFVLLLALYVWKNIGYNIVLLLAGLNAIPRDYYEHAAIEGAGGWQTFSRVTLPLLAPSLFFVFLISIVNAFQSFREAFLLGGNMPHDSIYMLQHFMNNNFRNLNQGRLSVAAMVVFAVVMVLVLLLYQVAGKGEEHGL